MPDFFAIEWAQFSVSCPECKSLETPTLGYAQRNRTMRCRSCGATIELETPEAKERQSEAAQAAMKRAADEASR